MADRQRFPIRQNVFTDAARTTHASSRTFYSEGARNARFDIDIDAFSGTSITFTVEWFDRSAGEWLTLLASAALSATGHTTLTIGPDLGTSANVSLQAVLPEEFRVTPSGTITSVTYSVQLTLAPA